MSRRFLAHSQLSEWGSLQEEREQSGKLFEKRDEEYLRATRITHSQSSIFRLRCT